MIASSVESRGSVGARRSYRPGGQFEIRREDIAGVERLTFTGIGQAAAAALAEFAPAIVAVARVVNRSRIGVHRHLRWGKLV